MRLSPWLLGWAALLTPGCAALTLRSPAPLQAGATRTADLRYHPSALSADRRSLDLFRPAGPGPHPVVIFVHGGFWKAGGRQADFGVYQRLGRRLANQGVVAAILSYRLAPEVHHPSQAMDVARAVATVVENLPSFDGDPSRVYLMGHSAGAHLSLLVAWDPEWLAYYGHSTRELAGVVGISGPYDLSDLATTGAGERNVPLVFGPDPQRWPGASPSTMARRGLPPTLLAIASDDYPVVRREGLALQRSLEAIGAPAEWADVEHRSHATIITRLFEDEDPLGAQVVGFVTRPRGSPAPTRERSGSAPSGTPGSR